MSSSTGYFCQKIKRAFCCGRDEILEQPPKQAQHTLAACMPSLPLAVKGEVASLGSSRASPCDDSQAAATAHMEHSTPPHSGAAAEVDGCAHGARASQHCSDSPAAKAVVHPPLPPHAHHLLLDPARASPAHEAHAAQHLHAPAPAPEPSQQQMLIETLARYTRKSPDTTSCRPQPQRAPIPAAHQPGACASPPSRNQSSQNLIDHLSTLSVLSSAASQMTKMQQQLAAAAAEDPPSRSASCAGTWSAAATPDAAASPGGSSRGGGRPRGSRSRVALGALQRSQSSQLHGGGGAATAGGSGLATPNAKLRRMTSCVADGPVSEQGATQHPHHARLVGRSVPGSAALACRSCGPSSPMGQLAAFSRISRLYRDGTAAGPHAHSRLNSSSTSGSQPSLGPPLRGTLQGTLASMGFGESMRGSSATKSRSITRPSNGLENLATLIHLYTDGRPLGEARANMRDVVCGLRDTQGRPKIGAAGSRGSSAGSSQADGKERRCTPGLTSL